MKNFVYSVICLLISMNTICQDNYESPNSFELSIEDKKPLIELNDKYYITHTGINTDLSDVGATFFMNKYIMYSSRKTGAIAAGKDSSTNQPYNALYCINIDKNGNLSHPYFFANVLNEQGNEAGIAFTPNQKTVYYTNSHPSNPKNYQLYKANFDETCRCSNAWIQKELLPISNTNYSIENPNITSDGKIIYFSSNMPGGFGGYDIYSAELEDDGSLKNVKNLGAEINTAEDEKFPYAAPTNELYFSSNGHKGYGGQDVFVSRIRKSSFSAPINLGKTINSPADEIAFILANKKRGYLTSNRAGALGSFDIFKFDIEKHPSQINGTAVEKNSNINLPNTKIILKDIDGSPVSEQLTDAQGNFSFETLPLEQYTLTAIKEGYHEVELPLITPVGNGFSKVALDQKSAVVTATNILIENIYFDYNQASIKKESTLSLNKIYEVLTQNPAMRIAINAHTDSRGAASYNLTLSDKRASAALQYLLNKGIQKDRLLSKGFGETQLLSKCIEKCTEIEYEKDRRIEFIIINQ